MTRLPENEAELETLVRERTDEITQYLASIVEHSDDAIISKDLRGMITSWNKAAERIFGYTSEEAIGKPITIIIPAERQSEEPMILERIARGQPIEHFETIRQRKQGSLIDISLTVSPIRNSNGTIIGASKIARDITNRKRREAELTTLAREAEHRAQELKQAIEGRVQALANVISLFAESRWNGAELQEILTHEVTPFGHQASRIQFNGPKLLLEPKTAQAVAITLHELVTNAVKYGALSTSSGRIHIDWLYAEHRLVLRWIESGGPMIEPPRREGFGTRLMETMVRRQLRGTIDFDWRPEGLACEIAVPT